MIGPATIDHPARGGAGRMEDARLSKDAALSGLQAQSNLGRRLLARPVQTEADLAEVTAARLEWALANKKLLHQIFGDAAGQVRFPHDPHDGPRALHPSFPDRVREYQQLMIDGLMDLDRVIKAMRAV